MRRWSWLVVLWLLAVLPVGVEAEYARARAESVIVANNGLIRIQNVVETSTDGGVVRKVFNLKQNFKEKLQEIKDTRKKQILEKINNRICVVNKNRLVLATKHLDKIEEILDKVASRSAGIEEAITIARQTISEARTAITTQSEKDCTIAISGDELKLGVEVRSAVGTFGDELKAVHTKIKDARMATAVVIQKLALILGGEVPPKLKEVD
jgi:hypothetical protein